MTTYLLLNIGIIFFPLIFSFEKQIRFYKKLPRVITSIITVSTFYVLWDIYATVGGHWGFSKSHSGIFYILGLPIEEILFFITVPYAMLFLYEVFYFYTGNKINNNNFNFRIASGVLLLVFAISAVIFSRQMYTFLSLASCALFFAVSFFYNDNANKVSYWVFILISYIPFLLVNYILTALPVVIYNPDAIWGLRVTTIPLEDFFYSFSMISFYILIYTASSKIFKGTQVLTT